jgi:hypothetical protein
VPASCKELPLLAQLLEKYGAAGLTVVGINYERPGVADAGETVKAYVAAHGVAFPCLVGDDATREQVPGFVGYPTTLFLDRSHKVRAKVVGFRPLIELEALVRLLLDEASKTN